MAEIDRDYGEDDECIDCIQKEDCCDKSCTAELLVAPCGTFDYDDLKAVANLTDFCIPAGIEAITPSHPRIISERPSPTRCGPPRRILIRTDFALSLTMRRCQSNFGNSLIRDDCPFDFIYVPKMQNFNGDLAMGAQQTEVIWGRFRSGDISDAIEDDDCQTYSIDLQTDGCLCRTKSEALIPNAG